MSDDQSDDLSVEFVDGRELDRAAWDAHVIATSGNPTQLAAFGELGGALRVPIYAEVRRGAAVVLRWLFYRAGIRPGLAYLDIRSEPTNEDPERVAAVLCEAVRRFRPFRIVFQNRVYSRWRSAETLSALGFDTLHPHGTVVLDLTQSHAELRHGIEKKQRNRINRGERDGLILVEQSNPAGAARLYPFYQATMTRSGAKMHDRDYVIAHAEALCAAGYGRIFFAHRDGVDYGAGFDIVNPARALAWIGGTCADAPASTWNWLRWAIITRLQAEGVAAYDLGGADTEAAEGSKGARIIKSKLRYGGVFTHHYGGTRTYGPLRAAFYDRLMRLRQSVRTKRTVSNMTDRTASQRADGGTAK